MKVLGIETSCDETAVAVVEDGQKVLSCTIASQIDIHAKTGGVVPEVAAREHILQMTPVLESALSDAGCGWDDIEVVAVTARPGLVSSLLIGTVAAKCIGSVLKKRVVEVNHIHGHIYSSWLELEEEPEFPILVLTVSGGHNELVLVKGHEEIEVLGKTRDDSAGEAFDKVARMLGMSYPGGPAIAKAALEGDEKRFDLPRPMLEPGSLDFSFSGLKSAVRREVENGEVDEQFKKDMAASFQECVVEVLSKKLLMALEKYGGVKEVHLVGGVSANLRLREVIKSSLGSQVRFRYPMQMKYCTDNAAMIAARGFYLAKSEQ